MLAEAEQVIHDRAVVACEAATAAGLPGSFEAWREDGLLAVLATAPELRFLRTISGVTEVNLTQAVRLAGSSCWEGDRPALVLPPGLTPGAGFASDGVRPIAVLPLTEFPPVEADVDDSPDIDVFLRILLDGYESGGAVTEFIAAEHRDPRIRRSLLVEDGVPISAAALSSHGPGVLLGGSATPRAHRGKGAQARLLLHGLAAAAREGHRFAVATAVEGSPSLSNLRRAGAEVYARQAWR
ncbi:hypothetical protein [Amycolatopsis sp. lyj-90]|uniref:hypothetical protein n=1 Tax=Amycolatopsis sp. lyj-90 TaxID=2789285 RepID=UPI00397AF980